MIFPSFLGNSSFEGLKSPSCVNMWSPLEFYWHGKDGYCRNSVFNKGTDHHIWGNQHAINIPIWGYHPGTRWCQMNQLWSRCSQLTSIKREDFSLPRLWSIMNPTLLDQILSGFECSATQTAPAFSEAPLLPIEKGWESTNILREMNLSGVSC